MFDLVCLEDGPACVVVACFAVPPIEWSLHSGGIRRMPQATFLHSDGRRRSSTGEILQLQKNRFRNRRMFSTMEDEIVLSCPYLERLWSSEDSTAETSRTHNEPCFIRSRSSPPLSPCLVAKVSRMFHFVPSLCSWPRVSRSLCRLSVYSI